MNIFTKKRRTKMKKNDCKKEISDVWKKLADEKESQVRSMRGFGVKFGIDAEDFKCRYDDRISYKFTDDYFDSSQNHTVCKDVLLDGKTICYLDMIEPYCVFRFLVPLEHRFIVPVERKDVTEEMRNNPHFDEDDFCLMLFSKLEDVINYLGL